MAGETLFSADADKYSKVIVEKAKANRFTAQLLSYDIAPNIFFLRHYLDVIIESTPKIRKFVLAVKNPKKILLIVDDKKKIPAGLLGLGEGISGEVEKQTQ